MKRYGLFLLLLLVVLSAAGCGKKNGKKTGNKTTETVTETPTPEPTPGVYVEEYAGRIQCAAETGGFLWTCGGKLSVYATGGGNGSGNLWEIRGMLENYTVTNGDGEELFRVAASESGTETAYRLQIGDSFRPLATVPQGVHDNTVSTVFQIYSTDNGMLFCQNEKTLFTVFTSSEFLTLSFPDGDDVLAYRFPVEHFNVLAKPEEKVLRVPNSRLQAYLQEPEKVASISSVFSVKTLLEDIRSHKTFQDWPAEYVQITGAKFDRNGKRTEYQASYYTDSVVVNRTESSASSNVTGYMFMNLSEGIPTVDYYIFRGNEDILEYTFETDELDDYRTALLEQELARKKALDTFTAGWIPLTLERKDFGFTERGICGEFNTYVRFYFTESVSGSILAAYADQSGACVGIWFDRLGDSEGRVYADGRMSSTDETEGLRRYLYDEYGVLVSEGGPIGATFYEYTFSDYSYGGDDDTVRHEWLKLMPYLEKAPKQKTVPPEDDSEKDTEETSDGTADGNSDETR
ncbi:MAG: hypothetical protein J6S78_02785 [Lachnospiraceae bacterium]|nr:hypothetical protein [Lachnospiraceae bacterium]